MNYTHIFWDWNGTLLDDADYCIEVVNISLYKRNLPSLNKEKYYKLFRFPIKDYYVDLGFDFDKESYDALAEEYNVNYASNANGLSLRKFAREALSVFKSKGVKQYILSASERTVLETALKFYGIDGYFEKVLCTDDYLASGKIEYGKKFADTLPKNEKKLLIGDTFHDVETAAAIGADCVLLYDGHTSKEKILTYNVPSVETLHDLYPIVLGAPDSTKTVYRLKNPDSEERRSFDLNEAEPKTFQTFYKDFYDDLKNTNKTEDW